MFNDAVDEFKRTMLPDCPAMLTANLPEPWDDHEPELAPAALFRIKLPFEPNLTFMLSPYDEPDQKPTIPTCLGTNR